MFPGVFTNSSVPNASLTNKKYKGWNVQVNRLFFANGVRECHPSELLNINNSCSQGDPWRDATLSADETLFISTPWQPIALGDGFHCSDLGVAAAVVDPTIAAVQSEALFWMKEWLKTWRPAAPRYTVSSPKSTPQVVLPLPQVLPKPISAWFTDFGTF